MIQNITLGLFIYGLFLAAMQIVTKIRLKHINTCILVCMSSLLLGKFAH